MKKKWIKLMIIAISVIIVGGLGYFLFIHKSMLVCTSSIEDNYRTSNMKFVIKYRFDRVLSVKETITHTFFSEEILNIYKEFLDESYNKLVNEKYIKIEKNIDGLKYIMTIEYDVRSISNEKLSSLELFDSLKQFKNKLSEAKFSC